MPATLAALMRRADLGVTLLCSGPPGTLTAPIRWVTTSELVDPTPYLRGGELLLTTGMRLPAAKEAVAQYVSRLAAVGIVGIGFGVGVGLAHRTPPPRLVAAAEDHAMALVVVDEPTPFIAIGEAVAQIQLADETAALGQALKAQQSITRAAVAAGGAGVVRQLATLIDGWAVVADAAGTVVDEAPAGASQSHRAWRAELGRLRGGRAAAAAIAAPGEYVSVHVLGDAEHVQGFLVTGRTSPPTTAHHSMTNVAVALLTVAAGRDHGYRTAPALQAALGGDPAAVGDYQGDTARAAAILDPLRRFRPHSRVPLATSVEVWLKHHGRIEPAAEELGLHRNTLRYRIMKAERLLSRDLDDPSARAELWEAFRAAD